MRSQIGVEHVCALLLTFATHTSALALPQPAVSYSVVNVNGGSSSPALSPTTIFKTVTTTQSPTSTQSALTTMTTLTTQEVVIPGGLPSQTTITVNPTSQATNVPLSNGESPATSSKVWWTPSVTAWWTSPTSAWWTPSTVAVAMQQTNAAVPPASPTTTVEQQEATVTVVSERATSATPVELQSSVYESIQLSTPVPYSTLAASSSPSIAFVSPVYVTSTSLYSALVATPTTAPTGVTTTLSAQRRR